MQKTILTTLFILVTYLTSMGQDTFEAEDGTITGASVSNESEGYSGTGYVIFEDTGNIKINVDRTVAGTYFLSIGYRAGYGEKTQDLLVNGNYVTSVVFPASNVFTTVEVGGIALNEGSNTVEINKNWGYMFIDYFIVNSESNSPPTADAGAPQVKMDTDLNGYEVFTLDASASTDINDDIVSYNWYLANGTLLGTGAQIQYQANMGGHYLTLEVEDENGNKGTDETQLFVGHPTNNNKNVISIPNSSEVMFANGINLAWYNFASDIVSLNATYFEGVFDQIEAAGGNAMRWWLHTNGNKSPIFDASGNVTGLNANTIPNMKKVLDLAQERGIKISMCLWSFDMLQPQGQDQQKMKGFLESKAKTQTYIDNALLPILDAIGSHPAVMTWEIFNEPEGMTEEFGWTPVKTQMKYVQQFVNMTAGAIHRKVLGALVSSGSWSFRASTDIEGNTNYYRDDRLIAAGGDTDGTLDFYQVHFYPEHFGNNLSPFHRPADWWELDKPIVLGEFPSRAIDERADPSYTIKEAYQLAYEYGYAGAMAWDFRGFDGGSFETAKEGISYLAENYPVANNFLGIETVKPNDDLQLSLYPNPIKDNRLTLKVQDTSPINVEIINILGKRVGNYHYEGQTTYTIDVSHIATGINLVRISSEKWSTTRKIIKQ